MKNLIIDSFPFFNELSLLELRLNELDSVVDFYILVEVTLTHSGKPKPLYYNENKARFFKFAHKIIHVIVEDMPVTPEQIQAAITSQDRVWLDTGYQLGDDWVRERFQRNAIMRGLEELDYNSDDIVIIEDADEMVKASVLKTIDETLVDGSNAVQQTLNTYYANVICTNMPWWGSKILCRKFVTNPSEHRFHTPAAAIIENGGWHFNFWGGADNIKQKIEAYAHQEFNNPETLENVASQLASNKDVFGRLYEYKVVPLDDNLPKYLLDNLDKFAEHIKK